MHLLSPISSRYVHSIFCLVPSALMEYTNTLCAIFKSSFVSDRTSMDEHMKHMGKQPTPIFRGGSCKFI